MKKSKHIALFLYGILFSAIPLFSFANDTIIPSIDTIQLDTVVIKEVSSSTVKIRTVLDLSSSFNTIPYALFINAQSNFKDALQHSTPIQINEYGLGNAATLTYRGANDDQTKLSWNGAILNTPSLGGADISLIPVEMIQYAAFDNSINSIGSIIHLTTFPDWKNKYSIRYRTDIGSYDSYKNTFAIKAGTNTIQFHTRAMYQTALNNFPYYDVYKEKKPLEVAEHNELKSWTVYNELFMKLREKGQLSFGNWYLSKDKNIPQIMGVYAASSKHQQDGVSRSYLRYKNSTIHNFQYEISMAYSFDQLKYRDKFLPTDSSFFINTNDKIHRFNHSLLCKKFLSKVDVDVHTGYDYTFLYARLNSYSKTAKEHQGSFFASLQYYYKIMQVYFKTLQPFTSYKIIRPEFNASLLFTTKNKLYAFNLSYADVYRFPDLNDRYWSLGGNPDLKPENGWNLECGNKIAYTKNKKLDFKFSLALYFSRIKNNIVWQPINAQIWTPQNITVVQRYGLENIFFSKYTPIDKFSWTINVLYNFNRTQIWKDDKHPELKGSYLAYRPHHTFKMNNEFDFHFFKLGLNYIYTSPRFTDKENYTFFALKANHLVNMHVGFSGTYKHFSGEFIFKINNLTNTAYESVRAYAQPLRNYSLSIILSLQNNSK